MPETLVTVAIPTLTAGSKLVECVRSLQGQTQPNVEIVVIDNSGAGLARKSLGSGENLRFIENDSNLGFGTAINQAWASSESPFIATLNDDAIASPRWLEALLAAADSKPNVGMCASQVRLAGQGTLDSAGMLICADGSSKQRGHLEPQGKFSRQEEVLLPSGSAALYRREMLDRVAGFDDSFFLYCEDTDLGLRARWAGWKCMYAPDAVVDHQYSQTAGRATPLKAYYVERNRLFLLMKNFPVRELILAPFVSIARYMWHLAGMLRGEGAAAKFRQDGSGGLQIVTLVAKAYWALIPHWGNLQRQRRAIRNASCISPDKFRQLLQTHAISAREVARL